MKSSIFITILLFCAGAVCVQVCAAQDVVEKVYLKDGSVIAGAIVEQVPNKSIRVKTDQGTDLVIPIEDIERIVREPIVLRDLRDVAYPELGISLGTPAGFNVSAGYWFGPLGIRAGGMAYGAQLSGIQGNVGVKLSDNPNRSHVLSLVFGTSQVEAKSWTYGGIVYNLNLSGFFLEIGLSAGHGAYTSPQLVAQIGYMHRFL